jgi:predicted nucleic acid-binding Zn finger protein
MHTAFVTPKSKKAKNCFARMMNYNDECIVRQHKGNKVFLSTMNEKYSFWVNIEKDSDWIIEF